MTGGFPHKGPVTRKMFVFDSFITWSNFHRRLESWLPNNAIDFRFDVDFKANRKLKIYPDMHGYNLDCATFTTTGRGNKSCLCFLCIYLLGVIDWPVVLQCPSLVFIPMNHLVLRSVLNNPGCHCGFGQCAMWRKSLHFHFLNFSFRNHHILVLVTHRGHLTP